MNLLKPSASCALGLLLGGCSVMHFKNGAARPEGRTWEQWHHNYVFSLIETKAPIDPNALCKEQGGNWARVTTQDDAVTAIVGGLDQAVTSALIGIGLDVWDPQKVEYVCGERPRRAAPPATVTPPASPAKPAPKGKAR